MSFKGNWNQVFRSRGSQSGVCQQSLPGDRNIKLGFYCQSLVVFVCLWNTPECDKGPQGNIKGSRVVSGLSTLIIYVILGYFMLHPMKNSYIFTHFLFFLTSALIYIKRLMFWSQRPCSRHVFMRGWTPCPLQRQVVCVAFDSSSCQMTKNVETVKNKTVQIRSFL